MAKRSYRAWSRMSMAEKLALSKKMAGEQAEEDVQNVLEIVAARINQYRAALMPDVDLADVRLCSRCRTGLAIVKSTLFKQNDRQYIRRTMKCVDCGRSRSYSFPAYLAGRDERRLLGLPEEPKRTGKRRSVKNAKQS
jgi:hypothetical protein